MSAYPLLSQMFGEVVEKFFSPEGISMSEAQRRKNSNTNSAEKLSGVFSAPVYYAVHTAISSSGDATKAFPEKKVTPEDFSSLETIAGMFAESAVIGHGINFRNRLERKLLEMSDDEFMKIFGIEYFHAKLSPPVRKTVSRNGIERVLQMERVEDILESLEPGILGELSDKDIFTALSLEAKCAVLGNQLTQKDCFLKRLAASKEKISAGETQTNFALLVKENIRNYSELDVLEFSKLQEELYEEYSTLQKELNSFKKQLKDLIRAKQLEFDKESSSLQNVYLGEMRREGEERNAASAKVQEIKTAAMQELASLKIKLA